MQETQTVQLLAKPFSIQLGTRHAKVLKKIVCIAESLKIEDMTFTFDGRSLSIRHMDVSRIALLKATINLRETALDDFTEEEDKSVFAVVLSQLKRALNLEEPHLRLDEKLYVTGKIKLKEAHLSLPLVAELESPEEVPEPKINFDVTATLNMKEIIESVEKLVQAPDYLRFVSNKTGIKVEFDKEEQAGGLDSYPSTGDGEATYSIDYLKALGSGDWKIKFSTDMPMKATRTVTENVYEGTHSARKQEIATIEVYFAPRIAVEG